MLFFVVITVKYNRNHGIIKYLIAMSHNSVSTECAICLVSFKSNSKNLHTTDCGHTFHSKCFDKIKIDSCPCCRAPTTKSLNRQIAESKIKYKNVYAKMNAFNKKIINELKKYKIVLSKNKSVIIHLENEMKKELNKNQCNIDENNITVLNYLTLIDSAKMKLSNNIDSINKHELVIHSARIRLSHAVEVAWTNMTAFQMNELNAEYGK